MTIMEPKNLSSVHFDLLAVKDPANWSRIQIARTFERLQRLGFSLPRPHKNWPMVGTFNQPTEPVVDENKKQPAPDTRQCKLAVAGKNFALKDIVELAPYTGRYSILRTVRGDEFYFTAVGARYASVAQIPLDLNERPYLLVRCKVDQHLKTEMVAGSDLRLVFVDEGAT